MGCSVSAGSVVELRRDCGSIPSLLTTKRQVRLKSSSARDPRKVGYAKTLELTGMLGRWRRKELSCTESRALLPCRVWQVLAFQCRDPVSHHV